jgi:hypothetical protein
MREKMDDPSPDHIRLDFLSYASYNRVPPLPSVGRPLHRNLSIRALGALSADLLQLWTTTTYQPLHEARLFPPPWRGPAEGREEPQFPPSPEEPTTPSAIEEVDINPEPSPNVRCFAISRPESREDRWVGPECLTLLLAAAGDETEPEYAMTLDTFAPRPDEAGRLLVSLVHASNASQQRRLERVSASSMRIIGGGGTMRLACEKLRGIPTMAVAMQGSLAFYYLLGMCALKAERSFWKDVEAWLEKEEEDLSGAPRGKDHTTIGISSSHAYLADRLPLQVWVPEEGKEFERFRERLDDLSRHRVWDEPPILTRNGEYRNIWLAIPPRTPNEDLKPIIDGVHELSERSHGLCHNTRERYESMLTRWGVRWGTEHAVSLAMASLPRDGPLIVYGASHSARGAKASVKAVLCLSADDSKRLLDVTAERAATIRWTGEELSIYRLTIRPLDRRASAWLRASAPFFGIPATDPVFVREFYNGAWRFISEKAPYGYPPGRDSVEVDVPFLRVPPASSSFTWPQLPSPIEPSTVSLLPRVSVTKDDIQKARATLASLS